MPKVRAAKRRARVNTGAGLTDKQIKERNEQAHRAFLAASRAAKRGFDQSKTKLRTGEGKDGKTTTSIRGSKGADARNAQAARADARRSGVIEKPTEKKKPFKAGRISRESGSPVTDAYGTQARAVSRKKKSIDTLQGQLQGMLTVLKLNRAPIKNTRRGKVVGEQSGKGVKGGNTQFEGTQIMERNRGDRTVIRDPTGKPKERKAGKLNYQTTTGAASALKSVCPLIKTELNGAFNNLLDQYQSKYKSIFDEQVANRGNPKPKITNTGRTGKGSLGGDTQKKPKAIGESKEDQKVMQS